VDTITTDNSITAVMASGQQIQGRITSANGRLQIGTVSVEPGEVTSLRDAGEQAAFERLLNPAWSELWAGTASIAWAGTGGNAKTNTFSIGVNAARATNTDRTSVYFNSIKASALLGGTQTSTAQAVRGGLAYNRNFTAKIFFNGFNDWEYDRFQALDLRATVGGGAGYHLWKADSGRLDLLGGFAWNHSKFDPAPDPKFTRNAAEAYWGDDFSYKLTDRTNLNQSFRMFNNLTDTGEYRMNFDVGAITQVFKWLTWNITFSDRYLSNPAPGRKTNDFLYSTGIGISFSH
jgi:putative salt-induced outer membrane protein YdiY